MAELPNGFKADRTGFNIIVSMTETDQFNEIIKLLVEMIADLKDDVPSEAEKKEQYILRLSNIYNKMYSNAFKKLNLSDY